MAVIKNLNPTGQPGVFFTDHKIRKHGTKFDRQWILRQTLGKVRVSVLGWMSEGLLLGDAINKAAEYKANHKWNKLNPDKQVRPVCKADEDAAIRQTAEKVIKQKALEKELNLTFSEYFEKYYMPHHEHEVI